MTHIGDSFQRSSILKDLSFRKFWIFGSFQNWSSFNELKWTKSIDGHSRQIQVRIRNSKISTTQSKLKDFPNSKIRKFHTWNHFSICFLGENDLKGSIFRLKYLLFCVNGILESKVWLFWTQFDNFLSQLGFCRKLWFLYK